MNNAAAVAPDNDIIAISTHAGPKKVSVVNPSGKSKRPRPIVTAVDVDGEELAWEPESREQFTFLNNDTPVRAGDSFAVVRPGHERWPLGHVSDVYKPTGHRDTVRMVKEACSESVSPFQKALMSGHGYRVAHQFHVLDPAATNDLHGLEVTSRLTVVHDHTGLHALKARMVVYVGSDSLGSIVGLRAIHVANNPEKWKVEVEMMVAKSIKAQGALMKLLKAADKHALTEADKALITAEGVNPPGGEWPGTLLDSMVKYHKGHNTEMTWGVWERRLEDHAIKTMVKVLGTATFGRALDEALSGKRYSGKTAAQWAEHDAKSKKK
jgi:hypothetical protein